MVKYFSFLAVLFLSVASFAQSEGGILTKSTNGNVALTPWSAEQALNAMTQPYTSKMADSTAATISTKYGAKYRLARIVNVSHSDQYITASTLNGTDTILICVVAQTASERLPFIRRVISGAVADSTRYDFLYK